MAEWNYNYVNYNHAYRIQNENDAQRRANNNKSTAAHQIIEVIILSWLLIIYSSLRRLFFLVFLKKKEGTASSWVIACKATCQVAQQRRKFPEIPRRGFQAGHDLLKGSRARYNFFFLFIPLSRSSLTSYFFSCRVSPNQSVLLFCFIDAYIITNDPVDRTIGCFMNLRHQVGETH